MIFSPNKFHKIKKHNYGENNTPVIEKVSQAKTVVPAERTSVSSADIKNAINNAMSSVFGSANNNALEIFTAQACLETAHGKSMYNYNFGGIKGYGPTGKMANLHTKEVLNNQEVSIVDGFRAYSSLEEGAKDFLSLLKNRYPKAVEAAFAGDIVKYAAELKARGYFTASLESYTNILKGIAGSKISPQTTTAPKAPSMTEDDKAIADLEKAHSTKSFTPTKVESNQPTISENAPEANDNLEIKFTKQSPDYISQIIKTSCTKYDHTLLNYTEMYHKEAKAQRVNFIKLLKRT